jgi:hypothetical protein
MTIFNVNPEDISNFTIEAEPNFDLVSTNLNFFGRRKFRFGDFSNRKSGEKLIPSQFLNGINNDEIEAYFDSLKDENLNLDEKTFKVKRFFGNSPLTADDLNLRYPPPEQGAPPRQPPETSLLLSYYEEILQKKHIIQDLLNPFYGFSNDWFYNDFHSLNFNRFDDESIALIYPNKDERYLIESDVKISFWVKPALNNAYSAGTIIHIPGCISLFLLKDEEHYKLKVQYNNGANIDPLEPVILNSFNFDNCPIKKGVWNFVQTSLNVRGGRISLKINVKNNENLSQRTTLPFSSSSIQNTDYSILSIGSFCKGDLSNENQKVFFNSRAAQTKGVENLLQGDSNNQKLEKPVGFFFDHQLVSEIYGIKIETPSRDIFYLKPSFSESTGFKKRTYVINQTSYEDSKSGILRIPFIENKNGTIPGTTKTPFNTLIAFGAGGNLINIENFLSDFSNRRASETDFVQPRIFGFDYPNIVSGFRTLRETCDNIIYGSNFFKRNVFIIPCDNGLDKKSQTECKTIDISYQKKIPTLFDKDLDELIRRFGSIPLENSFKDSGIVVDEYLQNILDNPDKQLETSLETVSGDSSSNQFVLFEIPNILYGKRIKPGSLEMKGSIDNRSTKITLKDDGQGGIFRSDSGGNDAKWNTVGRIYYNEGLVLIKNPHLYFFAFKEPNYSLSFKGEQNIHTVKFEVVARQNSLNVSKNTTFVSEEWPEGLSPTKTLSDEEEKFSYITNINFHDKNLNVVAKTQLAQPFVKRFEDKVLFRVQLDF